MIVKVIGLGGVGSHLIGPLCRYLEYSMLPINSGKNSVVLIDGDRYEAKNLERQEFHDIGNKAEISAERMKKEFPSLVIDPKPHYITSENIFLFLNEGDIIFMAVDNYATKLVVSDFCQTLSNVVLISGGNEYTDGDVEIYFRKNGVDLTPPLTQYHIEIANPKDVNPGEVDCDELAKTSAPQLIFANLAVATHMLSAFYLVTQALAKKQTIPYSEQYFDLLTGRIEPYSLKPAANTKKKKER